jgi:hypothetical protein
MPAKASKTKAPARAKPAGWHKLNLTRYIAATGDLAAAMKQYQKLLARMNAEAKIDVQAFDQALRTMNKAGDTFDKLTEKHEQSILDYVDSQETD